MWDKIVDFFNNIDQKFFDFDLNQYENLNFQISKLNSIPKIIFAFGVGVIIALIVIYYQKNIVGGLVRTLKNNGAIGEGNALSLKEAGINKTCFYSRLVTKNQTLSRYIGCKTAEIAVSFADDEARANKSFVIGEEKKYFLIEEKVDEAEKRYCNKGSDIRYLILSIVCVCAITSILLVFRNEIARLINSAIGLF